MRPAHRRTGDHSDVLTKMALLERAETGGITECWPWTAAKSPRGYGVAGLREKKDGTVRAHRLSYEIFVGPIPAGTEIHHRCHNTGCINPEHLEPLPVGEHRRLHALSTQPWLSASAARRNKKFCNYGHVIDGAEPTGKRFCRTCKREREARRSR